MDWNYFVDNFQFVNLFWAFTLPVALEVIDFLTGFTNACIRGERDSAVMRKGGGKKFGEAICLLVAQLFTWAMGLPNTFLYLVALYISFMELVSIVENVKLLGVVIPGKFEDKLNDVKDELKPKEEDDDSVLTIEHSATEDEEE